jgi:hypothetical protein
MVEDEMTLVIIHQDYTSGVSGSSLLLVILHCGCVACVYYKKLEYHLYRIYCRID